MPFGAALSFVLSLVVLALLVLVPAAAARRRRQPDGRGRAGWLRAGARVLVYLFLYAPLLVLVAFSFNPGRLTAPGRASPSTGTRALLRQRADPGVAAQQPDRGASPPPSLATVLGTAAALAFHRHRFRARRRRSRRLLTLPIVVPEIVLAASLLLLFAAAGPAPGLRSPWSWPTSRSRVSYAVVVVRARLRRLRPRAWRRRRWTWAPAPAHVPARSRCPASRPGVLAAALLVFALSIDDYVVTSFVAGVGATTLPVQIYSMVQERRLAGDQRRLDPAAGRHQPAALRGVPARAGRADRRGRAARRCSGSACWPRPSRCAARARGAATAC